MSYNTAQTASHTNPYKTVEQYADMVYKDFLVVPFMMWEFSAYVHWRKLALYR